MGEDFVLLASGASLHVVGNPFLHSGPPILFLRFPNSFVTAWMSCCGVVMHEGHNASFDLNNGGYDDLSFVGNGSSRCHYELVFREYCDVFIVGFSFVGTRWLSRLTTL